jgi:hypothetical protein
MDKWFKIIVDALKKHEAHPDERRVALVRAGQIAQAYFGCSESTLAEVFGSTTDGMLQNGSDDEIVANGTARQ